VPFFCFTFIDASAAERFVDLSWDGHAVCCCLWPAGTTAEFLLGRNFFPDTCRMQIGGCLPTLRPKLDPWLSHVKITLFRATFVRTIVLNFTS
jgi:hypothetical protein